MLREFAFIACDLVITVASNCWPGYSGISISDHFSAQLAPIPALAAAAAITERVRLGFNVLANDYSNMSGKYYLGALYNELDYYFFAGDDVGEVLAQYTSLTGRSPLRVIPLPITGRLHITVLDGQPNPHRMSIPVTVWPSVSTLLLWWLIAYLSILGTRWQSTLASSDSAFAIFPKLRADLPYLVELLLLGVLVIIPLRIIGWLLTLSDPGDGS